MVYFALASRRLIALLKKLDFENNDISNCLESSVHMFKLLASMFPGNDMYRREAGLV